MILKDYQENAVKKLLEDSRELLNKSGNKKIVFDSPTGSGKTIMMAELLKQLAVIKDPPLSFIWTAPGKLHYQSKEKLEKYYENSSALTCVNFQDLTDYMIQESQILFLNWESMNKTDKNIITRENERDFYLRKIIDNTKDQGHKIILIIDESHHHATSEISQNLISDINPNLVIEVSATPILKGDRTVNVDPDDVREQGMIKKSICFNAGFKNLLNGNDLQTKLVQAGGSQELLLEIALDKRQELANAYKTEGTNINPLLLIQLPDMGTPQSDVIQGEIESNLREAHKISEKNGKLAIYLSENKKNLEKLRQPDDKAEVLLFKQGIALGWDCPRAHILVLFRDLKSFVFSIQTVGRIMRMPEPDLGHYDNDILNHGYVFTNLEKISIQDDLAKEYITINISRRIENYKPIRLESFYKVKQMEKTRLNPRFIQLFLAIAETDDLKDQIDLNDKDIQLSWITDFEIGSVDSLKNKEINSDKIFDTESNNDLQKAFDNFVIQNLTPFSPQSRTIGRVKEAIHEFFNKLPFDYPLNAHNKNIKIVLNKSNQGQFVAVIRKTIDEYIEQTKSKEVELNTRIWEVPEQLCFSGNSKEYSGKKSVMMPFFYDGRWKTEMAFMDFLDDANTVEWWFKNGSHGPDFFAVDYVMNDGPGVFYVDFVVKFKDGTIGLFDPKSGHTIDGAGQKSDGLQSYIHKHRNIWGGIVTNRDTKEFKQNWIYYTGAGSNLTADNLKTNWKSLNI